MDWLSGWLFSWLLELYIEEAVWAVRQPCTAFQGNLNQHLSDSSVCHLTAECKAIPLLNKLIMNSHLGRQTSICVFYDHLHIPFNFPNRALMWQLMQSLCHLRKNVVVMTWQRIQLLCHFQTTIIQPPHHPELMMPVAESAATSSMRDDVETKSAAILSIH